MSKELKKTPAIPEPVAEPQSLRDAVLAMKEAVEVVVGHRGPSPFVTWEDLVRLGLVSKLDVPRQ